MSATAAQGSVTAPQVAAVRAPPLSGTLPFGLPALLYGLRVWAAVCLALYAAFALELENAYWAGTTAAIVCQPAVGAALRKGWFRLIGTVIGAVVIVVLTAVFPQSRAGFMITLALWGGACAFVASLLRNFASYAAALAGYTAAIIAGDTLGATGGASGEVFTLALTRATEITLGIACGTAVLALTDLGGARRGLAATLAGFAAEIAQGLAGALRPGAVDAGRPQRRELLRRVGGLGVAVDQAAGEISGLPFRPRAMQAAVAGLLGALSAWRLVATHLERRPGLLGPGEAAERVRALLPPSVAGPPSSIREAWGRDPERARSECLAAARELAAMPAETVSARLLAEGMAEGLLALGRVLVGVALLSPAAGRSEIPGGAARLPVPDLLPPLINLLRAVLTIGVAQLIWVVTAWPSGALMVVFASVTVILFAPREDAAYGMARSFLLGTSITAVLAAVIAFAVLPQREGFGEFCIAIGLVLVPAGALSAQAWQQPVFVAVAANFIPLLAPSNPMSYDLGTFYNTALALLAGVGMTALAFRLIPPLPPPLRARRLLALTLRDLRRLAGGRDVPIATWEARIYARLGVMPDQADPLQHARLVTALAVGTEILRLRRLTGRLGLEAALAPALDALRRGDSAAAAAGFSGVDRALAALPDAVPTRQTRLRARGSALALVEALSAHALYFDAHPPR